MQKCAGCSAKCSLGFLPSLYITGSNHPRIEWSGFPSAYWNTGQDAAPCLLRVLNASSATEINGTWRVGPALVRDRVIALLVNDSPAHCSRLAISQLGKGLGQELLRAGDLLWIPVATITSHAFLKLFVGQMLNQLRKHGAARVHAAFLQSRHIGRILPRAGKQNSNRSHRTCALSLYRSTHYVNSWEFFTDSSEVEISSQSSSSLRPGTA